jgi:DNA-binding GntR family transcriptional regulator
VSQRLKPPTAQEAVLAELRRALAARELLPGDQIRQETLAGKYGVSRVPLREALKILEGEGRVTYHPHRGYFVAELSADDLVEVYRLRELLEAEAITAAVPLLSEADLAAIGRAADDVSRADRDGDLAAIGAANRRFHFLLFAAAGRPLLTKLLGQLWDATDGYRAVYFSDARNRRRIASEHDRLLAAIRAGDADRAVQLQAAHRTHSVQALLALLVPLGQPRGGTAGNGATAARSSRSYPKSAMVDPKRS